MMVVQQRGVFGFAVVVGRLPAAILCAATVLVGAGCGGSVELVSVNPPKVMLTQEGQTKLLQASAKSSDGKDVEGVQVMWSSADPKVARVDEKGLVAAAGSGRTVVTAQVEEAVAKVVVDVVVIKSILVDKVKVLRVGEAESAPNLALLNEKNVAVEVEQAPTWTSSDPTVVQVGSDGKFAGRAVGSASVKVSLGDLSTSMLVTVLPPDGASK